MPMLCIEGANVSRAWLEAVRALARMGSDPRALHMVVSIADPITEEPEIRRVVDMLLTDVDLPPVDTVANTIFPAATAATCNSHAQLAERYLAYLPRLRKFKGNRLGTYFGRLIAYPGPNGPVDQLARAIDRMQKGGLARFTRYEALIDQPTSHHLGEINPVGADLEESEPSDPGPAGINGEGEASAAFVPIYVPGKDNVPGNFPCLSYCSFQLDAEGRVHAVAYYRSQFMVQRAYGNYLGLGRLLHYVAEQAGLRTGELTVVAGQAQIEVARRKTAQVASQPDTLFGPQT
jgi:hypothetical protein